MDNNITYSIENQYVLFRIINSWLNVKKINHVREKMLSNNEYGSIKSFDVKVWALEYLTKFNV